MTKPTSAPKPWEVRPRQPVGDATPDALYMAVGRALSNWGWFEAHLGVLFGFLMSQGSTLEMATRSFGSIRTFEGRLEMLRTASEVFFTRQPTALQGEFERLSKGAWREFGARRNEITHGRTYEYGPALDNQGESIGRYYLVPVVMDAQKRPLGGPPKYCYVAEDVEFYANHFSDLIPVVLGFLHEVGNIRIAALKL